VRLGAGIFILASALLLPCDAEAAACGGYSESVRATIKGRVEALRMIEREAADRLSGLDTRTFSYLAGDSRKAAAAVADPAALAEEDALATCRNPLPPLRRICRDAALMLATVLDEQEAGAATNASKQAYMEAMSQCERLMNLPPLATPIRTSS
jgi:hypothetical protein